MHYTEQNLQELRTALEERSFIAGGYVAISMDDAATGDIGAPYKAVLPLHLLKPENDTALSEKLAGLYNDKSEGYIDRKKAELRKFIADKKAADPKPFDLTEDQQRQFKNVIDEMMRHPELAELYVRQNNGKENQGHVFIIPGGQDPYDTMAPERATSIGELYHGYVNSIPGYGPKRNIIVLKNYDTTELITNNIGITQVPFGKLSEDVAESLTLAADTYLGRLSDQLDTDFTLTDRHKPFTALSLETSMRADSDKLSRHYMNGAAKVLKEHICDTLEERERKFGGSGVFAEHAEESGKRFKEELGESVDEAFAKFRERTAQIAMRPMVGAENSTLRDPAFLLLHYLIEKLSMPFYTEPSHFQTFEVTTMTPGQYVLGNFSPVYDSLRGDTSASDFKEGNAGFDLLNEMSPTTVQFHRKVFMPAVEKKIAELRNAQGAASGAAEEKAGYLGKLVDGGKQPYTHRGNGGTSPAV